MAKENQGTMSDDEMYAFLSYYVRVSNQLHHAGKILVFIVTSVEFQFPITADKH